MPTLVVDNGAGALKAGVAPSSFANTAPELDCKPVTLPNCTAKSRAEKKFFVADGLDTAVDLAALYIRRAHERGYVVNWGLEQDVWTRMCHQDVLGIKPAETSVLVTEPLFSPNELKDNLDEFIFEEMGFQKFCSAPPPLLAFADHKCWDPDSVLSRTGCGVIVDSGFSFSHIVPFYEGKILYKACRRIDLGGKALTNLLKETVSYRQWNMMDETVLMNGVKERLSFVSTDFDRDLATCRLRGPRNSIRRRYQLPTGIAGEDRLGCVLEEAASDTPSKRRKPDTLDRASSGQGQAGRPEEEAVLEFGNERFTVPEALFTPTVVGLQQSGVAEAVGESVSMLDQQLHSLMFSTVVAVGGNARIPGFTQRLQQDIRQLAPCDFEVCAVSPPQPADQSAWRGGMRLISSGLLDQYWVTKQEYEEKGHALCRQRLKDVETCLHVRKGGRTFPGT